MRFFRSPFWLATWLSGLFLTLCVRSGPGVLDSPEISAAVVQSGQIHPPGHPAYQAIYSLARWIPVGTLSVRIAFFSALALALSAGMLTRLAVHMSWPGVNDRRGQGDNDAPLSSSEWSVVLFSVLAVITPGVLEQGIRVEVYALHILLTLCALDLVLSLKRAPDHPRMWLALGVVLGLGGANHHYLTALCLGPATLWLVLSRRGHRAAPFGLVALGGVIGLLPYLALVVRAPEATDLFWSDTQSLSGFWDMITASAFQGSVIHQEQGSLLSNLQLAVGMILEFVGPLVFIVGFLGIVWAAAARLKGLGVVLLVIAGSLLSKSVMYMDPTNPDDRGYLSVAFVLFAWMGAFAACKVHSVLHRTQARPSYGRLGVHLATLCLLALTGFSSMSLAHQDRPNAQEFLRVMTHDLPSNALALTFYHQSYFLAQYGQAVEGRRPDVTQAQLSLGGRTSNNPARRAFRARHPQWADFVDAYDQAGGVPVSYLSKVAKDRPIVFEPEPSMTGLSMERASLGPFYARLHQVPPERSCRPREIQSRYAHFSATRGTTGLSAALGFTLMSQTMFYFRTGELGCAKMSHDLLKALAGASVGRLDPYFERCSGVMDKETMVVAAPSRAMANFPNAFAPGISLPDPALVCPNR